MAESDLANAPDDENFENFVGNWKHFRERLVLFLGAGASYGALNRSGEPLPNAFQLWNELWAHFKACTSSNLHPPTLAPTLLTCGSSPDVRVREPKVGSVKDLSHFRVGGRSGQAIISLCLSRCMFM